MEATVFNKHYQPQCLITDIKAWHRSNVTEAKQAAIRTAALKYYNNTCQYCGVQQDAHLHIHVVEYNLQMFIEIFDAMTDLDKSEKRYDAIPWADYLTVLCAACHHTQHISNAIYLGFCHIAYSAKFTQLQIINMYRNNILPDNKALMQYILLAKRGGDDWRDEQEESTVVGSCFAANTHIGFGSLIIYPKDCCIIYTPKFKWDKCSGQSRLDRYNALQQLQKATPELDDLTGIRQKYKK